MADSQSFEDSINHLPDPNQTIEPSLDRNFDGIAEHFEKKVYGGLKGAIRLAVLQRDLMEQIEQMSVKLNRPLKILDVGAGLAQLSIQWAQRGHQVWVNDISDDMLTKAQAAAKQAPLLPPTLYTGDGLNIEQSTVSSGGTNHGSAFDNMTWSTCPYQSLNEHLKGQFDLIMCHALLEWLGEPEAIMDFFDGWLAAHGVLSLCFYNPVSFDYRNLIMGNFNLLNNPDFTSDNKKSLTPNNPVAKEVVTNWLAAHHYEVIKVSGLRVFHDYAPLKRGGHNHPEEVIKMELRYSKLAPYKWMGRYLHYLAKPLRPVSSI